MVCRQICKRYKAKKQSQESYYELGHKRCSTCEIFISWDGTNCPCCGMGLRTKPRGTQGRHRMIIAYQKKNMVF